MAKRRTLNGIPHNITQSFFSTGFINKIKSLFRRHKFLTAAIIFSRIQDIRCRIVASKKCTAYFFERMHCSVQHKYQVTTTSHNEHRLYTASHFLHRSSSIHIINLTNYSRSSNFLMLTKMLLTHPGYPAASKNAPAAIVR